MNMGDAPLTSNGHEACRAIRLHRWNSSPRHMGAPSPTWLATMRPEPLLFQTTTNIRNLASRLEHVRASRFAFKLNEGL